MSTYGPNLRRLMARSGMTSDRLAELTGVSMRTIKQVLRGQSKPHARTLHRLAVGLNVSADEFFQPIASTQAENPNSLDSEIHRKVAQLRATEYGELLEVVVEVLCRFSGSGADHTLRGRSGPLTRESSNEDMMAGSIG